MSVGDILLQPVTGDSRYNDDNINFSLGGTWGTEVSQNAYMGKDKYTSVLGASIKFNFTGRRLTFIGSLYTARTSSVEVYIDGELYNTFSQKGTSTPLFQVVNLEAFNLMEKEHYVKIINKNATFFIFDAVDIESTGVLKPYNENINPQISINVLCDSEKKTYTDVSTISESQRKTIADFTLEVDTKRQTIGETTKYFNNNVDSNRSNYTTIAINCDITKPTFAIDRINVDTAKETYYQLNALVDSVISKHSNININIDTNRLMLIPIKFGINADTLRKTTKVTPFSFSTDTSRKMCGKFGFKADTVRALTVVLDPNFKPTDMGVKSISISTGVQSLSDRFNVETVGKPFSNVDNFRGEIAGFKFAFEKATNSRTTNFMGTTYTVQGRPDMADMLAKTVNIYRPAVMYNGGYIIDKTAKQLCALIGIDADITDFYPLGIGTLNTETFYFSITEKTVKSFLDKLFGWSAEFADRQMYYFNRNGKITVREVGRYTTNYNLDDRTKYQIENITSSTQKIRKFVDYSGNSDQPNKPKTPGKNTITPFSYNIGFSGSREFGDANLTYSSGYLMQEKTAEASTSYEYEPALHFAFASNKNVLKTKTTLSNNGTSRTTTTYSYDIVASSVYANADVDVTLSSERTIVETKSNGSWSLDSDHKTTHVPIGNGFYGQRVEEIDKDKYTTVATSISRGSAGGLASMYTVQLVNGQVETKEDPSLPKVNDYNGELVNGYNIPVANIEVLNQLIGKINWLDGKTEESISWALVLVNGADMVDAVGGVVTFEGNMYYIQSANTRVDGRGIRQQISAIRWY